MIMGSKLDKLFYLIRRHTFSTLVLSDPKVGMRAKFENLLVESIKSTGFGISIGGSKTEVKIASSQVMESVGSSLSNQETSR